MTDIQTAPLRYHGAKWELTPWLLGFFPPHQGYLDLFFGSGSPFWRKPRAQLETINDIDSSCVTFMRVLRDRTDELLFKLSLSPWSREEYQQSRVVCNHTGEYDELEVARSFYVNCWQSIGGEDGGWRKCKDYAQRGGRKMGFQYMLDALGGLYAVAERLMDVQIENKDAIRLASEHNNPTTLIYADPPYLRDTRSAHVSYRHDADSPEYHTALAKVLNAHSGLVVLSGYNSPLYEDLYPDWERHDKEASVNIGHRVESVWLNPQTVETLGRPKQLSMFE